MNRGFSLFQGEVAVHHLENDNSAFQEVREGSGLYGQERCLVG